MLKQAIQSVLHRVNRNIAMLYRIFCILFICDIYLSQIILAQNVRISNTRFVNNDKSENEIPTHRCLDENCHQLYNEIIGHMNKSVNPCKNIYLHMCSDKHLYNLEDAKKAVIPRIQNRLIDILNSPISEENDFNSLLIEKSLYQSCMKLDRGDDFKNFFDMLIKNILDHRKWGNLASMLESFGFDHAFFNIKIAPDPENLVQGIVELHPPSVEDLENLIEKINIALFYKNSYEDNHDLVHLKPLHYLFKFVDKKIEEAMQKFFESLIQIKEESSKEIVRITLKDLNKTNLKELRQIIQRTFGYVGIKISDDEYIIIHNIQYFTGYFNLLQNSSNHTIVSAILSKTIIENLMYHNWDLAKIVLGTFNKSLFCLGETKLYGVSHKFLYDAVNQDDMPLVKKTVVILNEIVRVINMKIHQSDLFITDKDRLEYELKLYSDNVMDYALTWPSNVYDDFKLDTSHFMNIIRYRKMIKSNKLKALRNMESYSSPFSFNEGDKPRNRFILNVFLHSSHLLSDKALKEYHYGSFGAKVAGFLYALLHEKSQRDGTRLNDWFAHPVYSNRTIDCLKSNEMFEYNKEQINEIITDIMGLRIAYEAMPKYDPKNSEDLTHYDVLKENGVTKDQLFYLAFVKSHCHLNNQIINTILFNAGSYLNVFKCKQSYIMRESVCPLKMFKS